MKLFLILLAINLQLSAAVYSQQIDITVKDAPLREVLQTIKKQSGYNFLVRSANLKDAKPVTVTLHLKSIEDALDKIFADQPLTFSIENKMIIVQARRDKKIEKSILLPVNNEAPIIIKGKITDQDNQPLPGVSIRIKGLNVGTTSDKDGSYIISAEPSAILVYSSVGYLSTEIKVSGRTSIDVKLQEYKSQLEETVVKGYYNTSKILNTGNVSSLKASEIAKQPVSDPLMALQGKIPGLLITQLSGVPGSSVQVSLRGRNSIKNGIEPLYIVDGVPFNSKYAATLAEGAAKNLSPFMNIRPEDIESIDVLKDADATAIYGSRGANGVILITTKKGKAGKTKVDFNVYNGIGQVPNRLNLMNTAQYLEMRHEALKNDGLTPQFFDSDINGDWDTTRNTDWQDVMIGGTAHFTNANATLSGGNENTQFLFGTSYRQETTVFPGDYINRIGSGNLNVHHTSDNKKLTADISVNYSQNNNRLPLEDFLSYIYNAPNAPALYNPDGSLNWQNSTWTNPFGALKRSATSISNNLVTNLNVGYSILPELQIKSSFGYNTNNLKQIVIYPYSAVDPAFPDPSSFRTQTRLTGDSRSWIIEPQIAYSKNFRNHHVDALVGTTFQSSLQDGLTQTATGFSSDALIKNFGAGSQFTNGGANNTEYHYTAVFARIGYNYDQKYIINLTGRRDGSSRFGPENRFGNFGAVGAAWVISKENFFLNTLPAISFAKLRGSIGKTGNDQLGDYAYLSTYNNVFGSYLGVNGLRPSSLTNPNYGWETINKLEGGLDLGFLNDRLLLNISYYRNRTKNQLVGYSLPYSTGFNTVIANLPAVIENKGLEMELNTENLKGKDLSWTTSANISFPRNKLVSFPNIGATPYATTYAVGQPLSIAFVYQYLGIDPNTGMYQFADLNKDGAITQTSDRIPLFFGNKFNGSISNTLSYKGLTLDFTFQFVKQTGYLAKANNPPGAFYANQVKDVLDRWRSPNQPGAFQQFTSSYADVYNAGDRYLQSDATDVDASFIRLRNVMLSWALPQKLLNKIRLQNLRVYMQGQNLLTITGYEGLDPENQRTYPFGVSLPPLRLITAGIQLSL